MTNGPVARSKAIAKSWRTLNWTSVFSAVIYPALGVIAMITAIGLGVGLSGVTLHWWYAPIAAATCALAIFVCNQGIGPLHRIWQHRAGELKPVAQIVVAINCILAMQGSLKDWINYHAQHHSMTDRPGDPHNPHEGKLWAWIGWILWRDPKDLERPLAIWMRENPVVLFHDRHHVKLSLLIHLIVPAAIYGIVWTAGGSLIFVFLLHAAVVIGRGLQFHATTLGVNVVGHLKAPKWLVWLLAVLTGGEAFHAHHHAEPASVLHLPRKGFFNRLVDYNGTMLLLAEKLRLARNFRIAPQFA